MVQDAETVAKVRCTHNNYNIYPLYPTPQPVSHQIQLHHGGSFSTLKDEPLHDWLKKKNPMYAFLYSKLVHLVLYMYMHF